MKKIGKYEICGLLGKGGMSVVYKARLPVVQKHVALKLLAPHPHLVSLWGEGFIRERFVWEAQAIATIRHPNVIEVLDFDIADGRPFFTMEYHYQNVGTILGEGALMDAPCRLLSLDKVIHYTRQLLKGLARLHRAGIVHRDIKPFNLLVTEADRLKICDFGLSRLRGESRQVAERGVIVGSPYYAAPEQERDPDEVGPAADLYAVGVVVCRMVTGVFPEQDGLGRIVRRSDAAEGWRDFVAKAIHPRVESRPAGALEMLEELDLLERDWRFRERLLCEAIHTVRSQEVLESRTVRCRSEAVKANPRQAPEAFDCDSLLRPLSPVRNDFLVQPGGKILEDRATGLLWELREWPDPLDWEGAFARVAALNEKEFEGIRTWRLPTVPELLSLAQNPAKLADLCETNPLDPRHRWFWTSDRRSFCAAWYVDTELGYAGWSDHTGRYFVRAVTSRPQD